MKRGNGGRRPGGPGGEGKGGADRGARGGKPHHKGPRGFGGPIPGIGPGAKAGPKTALKGRPGRPNPSKEEMGRLMAWHGVRLHHSTLDSLWTYHQFLRENNKDLDLTRLIGFETMIQRHYADCMILHGFMQGRWPSPLVDVGSGAGFPGLMIKLMSPGTRMVLAEPRPRRVDFLERAIKELRLKDITVFPHKVTSRSFTQPMAGTITRAFETVERSLPRFGGCLDVGGLAIFMKGPKAAEELTDLRNDEYKVVKNHVYRIPHTTLDRALLVMERIRKPESPAAYDAEAEEAEMADFEDGDEA
jgi:16S rRNA (guanine527-N7)-methyltransferase